MLDPNERMDIAQTHSILKNTYKWNICNRVKFTKNPEMREYLFGEIPYNDTTSFNYVCFSTGEAQLRYYKAFSILKNETAIDKVKTQNEYCCKNMAIPDTNIDYCKLMTEIILQPGGEIELSSPGGVTSDVETSYSNS